MDELQIDAGGRLLTPAEAVRARLAQHAGVWRLLSVGPAMLVALRRGDQPMLRELPQLEAAAPALAGDLAAVPPSDLLSLLHQSRRSGILLASSDGVERCLVLIDGQVTWAASTSPAEKVDVPLASVPEEQLFKELDQKAIEIVFGLLAAESGAFTFLRPPAEVKLPAVFALDTQAVLLDGLRRLDELSLYRSRISPAMRPLRVETSRPPAGDEVTPHALRLLELSNGTRTVAELTAECGLTEFTALRAVYHFLISGHLRDSLQSAAG